MEGLANGVPPDDYVTLAGAFLFAVNALFAQWPAELASYGFGVIGQDHDAALKAGKAKRAMREFFRWWVLFHEALQAMERDRPDLFLPLRLTATARSVVDKVDWVRTTPSR
jgi:hypothetical protein